MNSTTRTLNTDNQDDSFDILGMMFTLLEYKYFIGLVTLTFTIVGVIYALLASPIYVANAVIQVEEKSRGLPGMDEISEVFGSTSSASTEIELLKSRKVIGVAVDEEMLDTIVEPNYFPIFGKFFNRKKIPLDHIPLISLLDLDEYVKLGEFIEVESFSVPDHFYGEMFKLQVADDNKYKLFTSEGSLIMNGQTRKTTRVDGIDLKLKEMKAAAGRVFYLRKTRRFNAIKQYQQALSVSEKGRDTGIVVLSIEGESPNRAERILDLITQTYVKQNIERQSAEAANSLEFLHQKLPEIKKDLEKAELDFNEYQVKTGSVDITAEAEALLEQVVDIETSIAQLNLERANLDRIYTPDHPAYKAWKEQIASLESRKDKLNDRVKALPHTQQELIGYKRNVGGSTEIYTQMLANIQELDIVRAGAVGNVRVIDSAAADIDSPVRPKKKLVVLGAIYLGLFLSVVAVLIRKLFNKGITNPEEIETIGLPIYASVPLSQAQLKLSRTKGKRHILNNPKIASISKTLLAEEDSTDISIESLRSLRTSLHFAMLEAKNNLIMIGGPSPMVGKSFISANLAAVIAQSGKKVLLVDADMRRGYLHSMFGYDAKNGLSEVLINRIKLREAIKPTKTENLQLLSRGEIAPNPSELLMSERFSQLMESLENHFDYVIVDTPPILAVTDASIIGQRCGACLLVARYEYSTVKELNLAKKRFEQSGTPINGAILNGIKKSSSKNGYGYGYYNYNYEYGNKK